MSRLWNSRYTQGGTQKQTETEVWKENRFINRSGLQGESTENPVRWLLLLWPREPFPLPGTTQAGNQGKPRRGTDQLLRSLGNCVHIPPSTVIGSWFNRSVWPLDWGWYPELKETLTPRAVQNDLQTWDMNWGPRLKSVSEGMPWSRKTCLVRRSVVSADDGYLSKGM